MTEQTTPKPVTVIKKYANRRLYDTSSSAYITLDRLAAMTRDGRDYQVVDARSGEDITHQVLTQIIMEGESNGQAMLPTAVLKQLIALYGDTMQTMVPQYLQATMDAFGKNQEQFRKTLETVSGGALAPTLAPFEAMAKQNMAMFQSAMAMWTPKKAEPAPAAAPGEDVETLKARMTALQTEIDRVKKAG